MTLEIQDVIGRRDSIRTRTDAFCSANRQVVGMMRSASARFVERDFDPKLLHECFCSFCSVADYLRARVGGFSTYLLSGVACFQPCGLISFLFFLL
jgi:hypothetical protein